MRTTDDDAPEEDDGKSPTKAMSSTPTRAAIAEGYNFQNAQEHFDPDNLRNAVNTNGQPEVGLVKPEEMVPEFNSMPDDETTSTSITPEPAATEEKVAEAPMKAEEEKVAAPEEEEEEAELMTPEASKSFNSLSVSATTKSDFAESEVSGVNNPNNQASGAIADEGDKSNVSDFVSGDDEEEDEDDEEDGEVSESYMTNDDESSALLSSP